MGVVIHAEPSIGWHLPFAAKMQRGLKAIGIPAEITASRQRQSRVAILLGTSCWRSLEKTGDFLLVDRCSFGNTDEWVSLVWNGHGRRGDHKVPDNRGKRYRALKDYIDVREWKGCGRRVILCGQTEPYSPHYETLEEWYNSVEATHFRPHPAGDNPTGLPVVRTWDDVLNVVTLNSSIAVQTVLMGLPTVTMDQASMAWSVTSHHENLSHFCNRSEWLEWLVWTQWHHDEIAAGEPIKHIFEGI